MLERSQALPARPSENENGKVWSVRFEHSVRTAQKTMRFFL